MGNFYDVSRGDIFQHRLCSEEGNSGGRRDAVRRPGKCVKGEERATLDTCHGVIIASWVGSSEIDKRKKDLGRKEKGNFSGGVWICDEGESDA